MVRALFFAFKRPTTIVGPERMQQHSDEHLVLLDWHLFYHSLPSTFQMTEKLAIGLLQRLALSQLVEFFSR